MLDPLLQRLHVGFVDHLPEMLRLPAPILRRNARELLDPWAHKRETEVRTLAENDSRPAMDQVVHLGLRADQPVEHRVGGGPPPGFPGQRLLQIPHRRQHGFHADKSQLPVPAHLDTQLPGSGFGRQGEFDPVKWSGAFQKTPKRLLPFRKAPAHDSQEGMALKFAGPQTQPQGERFVGGKNPAFLIQDSGAATEPNRPGGCAGSRRSGFHFPGRGGGIGFRRTLRNAHNIAYLLCPAPETAPTASRRATTNRHSTGSNARPPFGTGARTASGLIELTVCVSKVKPGNGRGSVQRTAGLSPQKRSRSAASQKPRKSVLLRGGNPGAGVRFSTRYSMPRRAQNSRLPPRSPSSFTA